MYNKVNKKKKSTKGNKNKYSTRRTQPNSDHYGTNVELCEQCELPMCEHKYCINDRCKRFMRTMCNCYTSFDIRNKKRDELKEKLEEK